MIIKQGDFVTLEYIGKVDGKIFDLTDEALAKKENVYRKHIKYGPVTVIVGHSPLIKGIDKSLEGRKEGETFDIKIQPEDGFGKKNPKLIKIIPSAVFKQQKMMPQPGMQVNIDGLLGNIISVSSGRVIIDFNHPLAGKTLDYNISIKKIVTDKRQKVESVFDVYAGIAPADIDIKEDGSKLTVHYKTKVPLPEKLREAIAGDIKKYIGFEEVDLKEEIISREKDSKSETKNDGNKGDLKDG